MAARIQYATTADGVTIAYADEGQGYPILVLQGPPFSHIQRESELPSYQNYNGAVMRGRRGIRLDFRGCGLSQRSVPEFTLDGLTEDVIAVVDKLGLQHFAVYAAQSAGLITTNLIAHRPGRVSHVVFIDAYADAKRFTDIPQVRAFLAVAETDWFLFTETLAHSFFGWDAGQPAREYAQFLRDCVNQEECVRFWREMADANVTDLLPSVTMPTLVMQHDRSVLPNMDMARQLTSSLPNAELILLKGFWNDLQDDLEVLDRAITRLIGGEPAAASPQQHPAPGGLVTILFTDIEASTALTQRLGDVAARDVFREHERITREALARHGGSEVKTMGDGFMASFGSAHAALVCAVDMQRAFAERNAAAETPLSVRIGVNAGEPIAEQEDLFGTAVITAARIAAKAQGGEVLVSNVVRELVAGRGFLFADRGEMALRGFDDPVRVYEMKWKEDR